MRSVVCADSELTAADHDDVLIVNTYVPYTSFTPCISAISTIMLVESRADDIETLTCTREKCHQLKIGRTV